MITALAIGGGFFSVLIHTAARWLYLYSIPLVGVPTNEDVNFHLKDMAFPAPVPARCMLVHGGACSVHEIT